MATSRAYISSPMSYTRKTSITYVPSTMSRTRRPSASGMYTTSNNSYGSTYGTSTRNYGTSNYSSTNNYGTSRNNYGTATRYTGTTTPVHTYGTTSRIQGGNTSLHRVSSPRPLPAGPGPLDEHGHRMTISESLRRTSNRMDNTSTRYGGPVRATHTVASVHAHSPVTNDTSSLLSRSKRTSSVNDLTAGIDRMDLSSTNGGGSLARSKRYGSHMDIASTSKSTLNSDRSSTVEKEHIDDLFDSSGAKMSGVSKNYFSTNSKTYDYKDNEHESSSAPGLPSINRKRSTAQEKQEETLAHRPSFTSSSRQSSNSSMSTSNTHNYSNRTSPENKDSSRGLVGLKNLGNTCFMNSILQCLSNTRLLLDYCTNDDYRDDINTTTSTMKGNLMLAYAKLVKSIWKNSDTSISPSELKGQLQKYAPRFMGYNQQDSQEALIYLLEGLHEDVNRVTTKKKHIITNDDEGEEKISASEKARETWKKYLERDNSKIVDIFVGQLKSTLKCTSCSFESNTFDTIWDISLPIKKSRSILNSDTSLYDCFDWFTQEEILDGDEKPSCARCKQRRKCTKSFSIQKFPKILIVHLKRFEHGSFRKLSTLIDFPLKDLDLTKYAAEKSAARVLYNLYAVSNHSGTPFSGHYTAYCRHAHTAEWHHYNDSRVSPISPSRIKSSEAYVLFYELATQPSRL